MCHGVSKHPLVMSQEASIHLPHVFWRFPEMQKVHLRISFGSKSFSASCGRRLNTKSEISCWKNLVVGSYTSFCHKSKLFSTNFTSLLHSPCLCSADRSQTDSGLTSCCPASLWSQSGFTPGNQRWIKSPGSNELVALMTAAILAMSWEDTAGKASVLSVSFVWLRLCSTSSVRGFAHS